MSERSKLLLTAGILNSEREVDIFEWLALVAPDYSGQFNKRFETWINKQAGDKFGIEVYKNWGIHGEDKEYPKVIFYLRKSDYQLTDVPKYEFSINYKGQQVGRDYDTGTDVLRDHTENERLFGLASVTEIVDAAKRIITNRRESVAKMQNNLRELPKLEAERAKLKDAIDAYNNKISWVISDEMRIK